MDIAKIAVSYQLVILGCILLVLHCETTTTLISEGSQDGQWTFAKDSSVTLTCNITSYAGEMKWKFNSTEVASCSLAGCYPLKTGGGAFTFGFDTVGHIFVWTIDPVKLSHHSMVFECYDGNAPNTFTANVVDVVSDKKDNADNTALIIAGTSIGIIFSIIVTVSCICLKYNRGRSSKTSSFERKEKITAMTWVVEKLRNRRNLEWNVALNQLIETIEELRKKWEEEDRKRYADLEQHA